MMVDVFPEHLPDTRRTLKLVHIHIANEQLGSREKEDSRKAITCRNHIIFLKSALDDVMQHSA